MTFYSLLHQWALILFVLAQRHIIQGVSRSGLKE
jgi:ABC-type maltose transport system permease subunit